MYVIDSVVRLRKQHYKKLHENEAPISLLCSILANVNRDAKKKRNPYEMSDFYLYESREDMNIPSSVYGAAALALIEEKKLPNWALFIYKDLRSSADGPPPKLLAFIGDDMMILAPLRYDNKVKGMLVCMERAYGQERLLRSPCGEQIKVRCIKGSGKYFAKENVELEVIA